MTPRPALHQLLSPEARLVFACIDEPLDTPALDRALAAPLDWDALVLILDRESAAAPVWRALERYSDRIPDDVALRLRALSRVRRFRMSGLEERLDQTAESLQRAGIPCMLLKGVALATAAYQQFADRPMRDIDLLVRPPDVPRALEVLLASGWRTAVDPADEARYARAHHLPPLVDAGGLEVALELHRSLLGEGHPFRIDLDDWWTRSTPSPRAPSSARVFAPEHLLLHACIHLGYSHLFRQGAWRTFRDVRRIVALDGFEWERFVRAAIDARAASCAYWVLRLARDLAGMRVPERALDRLAPPQPEPLKRLLARHLALVLAPGSRDCPSVRLRQFLWSAAIMPRWSGHTAERPWTQAIGIVGAAATEEDDSPAAVSPSRRPDAWRSYLGMMLLGR